jgi:iron(III) transport system ATP-binding protein
MRHCNTIIVNGLMSGFCRIYLLFIMSKQPILQLQQVSKGFPQSQALAVNQVSLVLQSGEILGLLGPSGCGKTTLLRLIAGFEPPQSGEIWLGGELIASGRSMVAPERRDMGMVFQDYALFPHLTVLENVLFGLRGRGTAVAREALQLVGLEAYAGRYPHELSGGQQQRVALARAIAPAPKMILLDEPLSNLDIQVRLHLRQEIRSILKQAGTSAIFVTHDQEEALCICDRVGVMNQGHLVQMGQPEELYCQPRSRFVAEFITQANFLPLVAMGDHWVDTLGLGVVLDEAAAWAMVRQESIVLLADADSGHRICDRQFLGREYRYRVRLASGEMLCAIGSVDRALAEGTQVQIKILESRGVH